MAKRYMMATKAFAKDDRDISRDVPSLCWVELDETTDTHYIGAWVTGFGFINVHFPKTSTRELTAEEREKYNGKVVAVAGGKYVIDVMESY